MHHNKRPYNSVVRIKEKNARVKMVILQGHFYQNYKKLELTERNILVHEIV